MYYVSCCTTGCVLCMWWVCCSVCVVCVMWCVCCMHLGVVLCVWFGACTVVWGMCVLCILLCKWVCGVLYMCCVGSKRGIVSVCVSVCVQSYPGLHVFTPAFQNRCSQQGETMDETV